MRTEQKWEKLISNRTDSSVSVDERQIKESWGGWQRSLPLPDWSRKIEGPLLAGYCTLYWSITNLSFFPLFLRRQYNYVLTSQKRASEWLKISCCFSWTPSIQNKKFKVSHQKSGQKCKLLCHLKDKGKRYSFVFSCLFLSRCCCVRANQAIVSEKVLNEKVVGFALFYLFCWLLAPNKTT